MMKKILVAVFFLLAGTLNTLAHFQMIIPSQDIVNANKEKTVTLDIRFTHPMEGHMMDMDTPAVCGVKQGPRNLNLIPVLHAVSIEGRQAFTADFTLTRPGDYIFYVVPAPYWEPDEDCYIIHYTKVIVNAFGREQGWNKPVGLKTEILPLTRPYGLWTGNLFRGIVLLNNDPVPYAEIEVEYFNAAREVQPPAAPFITQVITADGNGVFSYAMPKAGWWGFAALNEGDEQMTAPDGHTTGVEIGALMWVRVEDMK